MIRVTRRQNEKSSAIESGTEVIKKKNKRKSESQPECKKKKRRKTNADHTAENVGLF